MCKSARSHLRNPVEKDATKTSADLRFVEHFESSRAYNDQSWSVTREKPGFIGAGAVGTELAKRAYAFGMQPITINDHYLLESTRTILDSFNTIYVDNMYALAECSDIVSVHVPKTPETAGFINARFFSHMKNGAILLNTARGDIIDEQALIEATNTKNIRAGLDVFQNEPETGTSDFISELAQHRNIYGTHHIGASTTQSQDAVAEGVCDTITAFVCGKTIHKVN